jgi:Methylamine utilisation protein MauE
MADALTPPLLVAGAVLIVAAVAKLRAPAGAAGALVTLGVPVRGGRARGLVRLFAIGELGLGVWGFVTPSRAAYGLMAALYAGFAVITLVLARRRASCGCFGADGPPASATQSLLNSVLALVALLAALVGAHGTSWLLDLPGWHAVVLALGLAASVYAAVLAYTVVPTAWAAWSGR